MTGDGADHAGGDLTRSVVASFDGAGSARDREVLQALVSHLHAFVTEVELTEEEWFAGIDFLTRTGHTTTARRQEWVLLSDVLGVSMLVVGLNDRTDAGATPSTVFGPFFVDGSPHVELGGDLARGAAGVPCHMAGRVVDVDGTPIAGARVEVWQSDEDGLYDVQRLDLDHPQGRGHVFTDADGGWRFWSVLPVAYPIPDDGPVGDLLAAAGRGPMRPAHVHFMVTADGYRRLITHVFDDSDRYLDRDAVFGVRPPLIATFAHHAAGSTAPDGTVPQRAFATLRYDLVLAADAGRGATATDHAANDDGDSARSTALDDLRDLEHAMWRSPTRGDRTWMQRHLAPEFTEHGASGRRWTRAEILDVEIGELDATLADLRVRAVGDDAALVTYRCELDGRTTQRSSLWRRGADGWLLVFHQGTPTAQLR